MNEVIRQLGERKSVRAFEERALPPEVREAILESAVMAPTAGNQQLYTIIDVTDPEKKAGLVKTCDDQPFIAKSAMALVFCADCKKWYDAFSDAGCAPRKPGAGDLLLAVDDAIIAAQNAVTAAWSLGVGSCYIGDVMENCEAQRELLGLPEYVFPAALVVFGYPTEQQSARPKPKRVEMRHVVHENAYRAMDGAGLREMLKGRAGEAGYESWIRAFCERKYNSGFSREMTRSVEKYLEDFEGKPEPDYALLSQQLKALAETDGTYVPLLSNAAALLWAALPDVNWAGFYVLRGDTLVLGPFQGKPACIHIHVSCGVCGAAVREDRAQRVADVHAFPGHVACDSASRSELVLPIHRNGAVVAVLDLDSPVPERFSAEDEAGMLAFVRVIEEWAEF